MLQDVGYLEPKVVQARAAKITTSVEYRGLVKISSEYKSKGISFYGEVASRITWGPLVGGEAVMRDCMDQSNFGTFDTKTQKAITVGAARENLNATFVLTDGSWKLSKIYSPPGEGC